LPPSFETSEGIPKPQNAGQIYLWKCWIDFCARTAEFKPDFMVVNGDIVDGRQQAQRGTEWSLPLMTDQKAGAVEVLKKLRESCPKNSKAYFLAGTPYHAQDAAEAEEDIALRLGATKYSGVGTGRLVREVLDLQVEGCILNFAHHIGVGTGFYRATAADREGQWSAIAGKDASKGVPKADACIRSHAHFFIRVEHASKHILQTPCWQLQTRYARKASVYRMLPDIGGIMLEIDGTAKDRYEDPIKLIKHLYPLPPAPVVRL
jgi:hypothetical protein